MSDGKIKSRFDCSQIIEDKDGCKDKRNKTGLCRYDLCPRKTGKPPVIHKSKLLSDEAIDDYFLDPDFVDD